MIAPVATINSPTKEPQRSEDEQEEERQSDNSDEESEELVRLPPYTHPSLTPTPQTPTYTYLDQAAATTSSKKLAEQSSEATNPYASSSSPASAALDSEDLHEVGGDGEGECEEDHDEVHDEGNEERDDQAGPALIKVKSFDAESGDERGELWEGDEENSSELSGERLRPASAYDEYNPDSEYLSDPDFHDERPGKLSPRGLAKRRQAGEEKIENGLLLRRATLRRQDQLVTSSTSDSVEQPSISDEAVEGCEVDFERDNGQNSPFGLECSADEAPKDEELDFERSVDVEFSIQLPGGSDQGSIRSEGEGCEGEEQVTVFNVQQELDQGEGGCNDRKETTKVDLGVESGSGEESAPEQLHEGEAKFDSNSESEEEESEESGRDNSDKDEEKDEQQEEEQGDKELAAGKESESENEGREEKFDDNESGKFDFGEGSFEEGEKGGSASIEPEVEPADRRGEKRACDSFESDNKLTLEGHREFPFTEPPFPDESEQQVTASEAQAEFFDEATLAEDIASLRDDLFAGLSGQVDQVRRPSASEGDDYEDETCVPEAETDRTPKAAAGAASEATLVDELLHDKTAANSSHRSTQRTNLAHQSERQESLDDVKSDVFSDNGDEQQVKEATEAKETDRVIDGANKGDEEKSRLLIDMISEYCDKLVELIKEEAFKQIDWIALSANRPEISIDEMRLTNVFKLEFSDTEMRKGQNGSTATSGTTKKVYTSSMYYNDQQDSFPTIEQQVEQCRTIAQQLDGALVELDAEEDEEKSRVSWGERAEQPERQNAFSCEHSGAMGRLTKSESSGLQNLSSRASRMFKRRRDRMNRFTLENSIDESSGENIQDTPSYRGWRRASECNQQPGPKQNADEYRTRRASLEPSWQVEDESRVAPNSKFATSNSTRAGRDKGAAQQESIGRHPLRRWSNWLAGSPATPGWSYCKSFEEPNEVGQPEGFNKDSDTNSELADALTDTEYEAPRVRRRAQPSRATRTPCRERASRHVELDSEVKSDGDMNERLNSTCEENNAQQEQQQQQGSGLSSVSPTGSNRTGGHRPKYKPFLDSSTLKDIELLRQWSPYEEFNEHNSVSPEICLRLVQDIRSASSLGSRRGDNENNLEASESAAPQVPQASQALKLNGGHSGELGQERQVAASKGALLFERRQLQSAEWIVSSSSSSQENKLEDQGELQEICEERTRQNSNFSNSNDVVSVSDRMARGGDQNEHELKSSVSFIRSEQVRREEQQHVEHLHSMATEEEEDTLLEEAEPEQDNEPSVVELTPVVMSHTQPQLGLATITKTPSFSVSSWRVIECDSPDLLTSHDEEGDEECEDGGASSVEEEHSAQVSRHKHSDAHVGSYGSYESDTIGRVKNVEEWQSSNFNSAVLSHQRESDITSGACSLLATGETYEARPEALRWADAERLKLGDKRGLAGQAIVELGNDHDEASVSHAAVAARIRPQSRSGELHQATLLEWPPQLMSPTRMSTLNESGQGGSPGPGPRLENYSSEQLGDCSLVRYTQRRPTTMEAYYERPLARTRSISLTESNRRNATPPRQAASCWPVQRPGVASLRNSYQNLINEVNSFPGNRYRAYHYPYSARQDNEWNGRLRASSLTKFLARSAEADRQRQFWASEAPSVARSPNQAGARWSEERQSTFSSGASSPAPGLRERAFGSQPPTERRERSCLDDERTAGASRPRPPPGSSRGRHASCCAAATATATRPWLDPVPPEKGVLSGVGAACDCWHRQRAGAFFGERNFVNEEHGKLEEQVSSANTNARYEPNLMEGELAPRESASCSRLFRGWQEQNVAHLDGGADLDRQWRDTCSPGGVFGAQRNGQNLTTAATQQQQQQVAGSSRDFSPALPINTWPPPAPDKVFRDQQHYSGLAHAQANSCQRTSEVGDRRRVKFLNGDPMETPTRTASNNDTDAATSGQRNWHSKSERVLAGRQQLAEAKATRPPAEPFDGGGPKVTDSCPTAVCCPAAGARMEPNFSIAGGDLWRRPEERSRSVAPRDQFDWRTAPEVAERTYGQQALATRACSFRVCIRLPNNLRRIIVYQRPKVNFAIIVDNDRQTASQ